MKFRESDTGTEDYYAQSPGLELDDIIGEWQLDYNNIAPHVQQGVRQVVPV